MEQKFSNAFVESGCFKYVNRSNDDREHIMEQYFDQSKETMKLRAIIAEHILFQFRSRYLDLHCATARERYESLLQRCPGIVQHLALQDIASFLNVTPKTISKIRKEITFGKD